MSNKECDICGSTSEVHHLPIYANGSEGVEVCISCRIVLTEVVRGMTRACVRARVKDRLKRKQAELRVSELEDENVVSKL